MNKINEVKIKYYQNAHGQYCTDIWLDGKYSRIPDYLSKAQAVLRVESARKVIDACNKDYH